MATADLEFDADELDADGHVIGAGPPDDPHPQATWETTPNVPVFAEHRTKTRKGRELVITRPELEAICERCNRRIDETGDYAMVTIGHTPSPEARAAGAGDPPVVGQAGPFRMGQIGRGAKRRWAILADIHIRREHLADARANPRRSPELFLEQRFEDMFLDPIALLGAETPRLDLGLLYSYRDHGREVEKYSACMGGPVNTFTPTDDVRRRYEASSTKQGTPMDEQALINNLVNALNELDWVKWCKAQMQKDTGPTATATGEGGGAVPAANPAEPPPADDANKTRMQAEPNPTVKKDKDDEPAEKYSALHGRVQQLEGELKRVGTALENATKLLSAEQGKRVDAERYAALHEDSLMYEVDLKEEVERCKYSAMSEDQFKAHRDSIHRNYRKRPVDMMVVDVPMHTLPNSRPAGSENSEKYSRETSARAIEICQGMQERGENPDFNDVLAKVRSGDLK